MIIHSPETVSFVLLYQDVLMQLNISLVTQGFKIKIQNHQDAYKHQQRLYIKTKKKKNIFYKTTKNK